MNVVKKNNRLIQTHAELATGMTIPSLGAAGKNPHVLNDLDERYLKIADVVEPVEAAYGNMYVVGNETATTISSQYAYTKFTGFTTNGQSLNTTCDHANDKLTLGLAGRYLITMSFDAIKSGDGNNFIMDFFLYGDGGVGYSNLYRSMHISTYLVSGTISGIINVSAGSFLEFYMANLSNTSDVLIQNCSLSAVRVGA